LAARRIAFGKVLNGGQTCVEPDYLLIQDTVKEAFGREFQKALDQFFPGGDYSNLPVIVNQKHYERLKGLLKGQKAAVGGGWDDGKRQIFPTLLEETDPDSPI